MIFSRSSQPQLLTANSNSPLQLNLLGKEISEELEVPAWAKRVAPPLFPQVEGKQDYEIHNFSFDLVKESAFSENEEMTTKVEICPMNAG